jgi:hypothetical protein
MAVLLLRQEGGFWRRIDVLKTSDVMAFVLQMNAGPALSEKQSGKFEITFQRNGFI